ncbi:lolD [Symbiodinium natans]|uniref:LolD protein n=1 Tax=Symbiodinium natans TaxID=878477 RepID=A0A812GLF1_9DINO|nr:lolD [Symbiodinium natans]
MYVSCCDPYQPLQSESSRQLQGGITSGSSGRLKRTRTDADIVQFTTAIYYVEEDEGRLTVDIMRLGSMKGAIKVRFATEDGSAKAGLSYEETFGEVLFEDQEYRKSIDINTIASAYWTATMEFKVRLLDPEGCNLGNHLHTCRVKIIDTGTFPSVKYEDQLRLGHDGLDQISPSGLFWEYWKLCFYQVPGIAVRTVFMLIFDQLKNVYRYFILCLNIYLVDVLFNMEASEDRLWMSTRLRTAYAVAISYVAPMLVLHAWDLIKANMDVQGHLRLYLQASLFRRYLNYSEESRVSVPPADMQHALSLGSKSAAEGYTKVMDLFQKFGQLAVFTYFTLRENPDAIYLILAMPSLMAIFLAFKACMPLDREGRKDIEASVLSLAAEVCQRYRLIADYFQRPQMNEIFARQTNELRREYIPENIEGVNNEYFPKWLGPVFVAAYIALDAQNVFDATISLGTFLATISVMKDISSEFADAYTLILDLAGTFGSIQYLTTYFNKETDLLTWKGVNRTRRELTRQARDKAFAKAETPADGIEDRSAVLYKTDLIPIQLSNMCYGWIRHEPIFENVNVSVDQGKLVAVMGSHGSGKATLLKLLGHMVFPTDGAIFIPSHLRILHVTQEAFILNLSAWQNLIFGCPNPHTVDPRRVRRICERLKMKVTLELIKDDLEKQEKLRGSPSNADEEDSEEEEEGEKDFRGAGSAWQESLTYSEKVKLHLARALIMNPEVLVLQRPLHHYDKKTGELVLDLLKENVQSRGLELPEKNRVHRRPRTCFFTVEAETDAHRADVVWYIDRSTVRNYDDPGTVTSEFFKAKTLGSFHMND